MQLRDFGELLLTTCCSRTGIDICSHQTRSLGPGYTENAICGRAPAADALSVCLKPNELVWLLQSTKKCRPISVKQIFKKDE